MFCLRVKQTQAPLRFKKGNWGTDYMRETGSYLTQLGIPKTIQVWEYFLYCVMKKCVRSVKELKPTRDGLL